LSFRISWSEDDAIGRVAEKAWRVALNTTANLLQELAGTVVDHDPVKMSVGHQNMAKAVDGEATGAIDVQCGHVPVAQVFTVAIEDLDAVGEIGDIEIIVGVESGHAGLGKPAWPAATDAPDEVGRVANDF